MRRERRWTPAGATAARELVRLTAAPIDQRVERSKFRSLSNRRVTIRLTARFYGLISNIDLGSIYTWLAMPSNSNPETPPPPVIECTRLLCYAVVDSGAQFSGRTLLFVDGRELGEVPCLAICEEKKSSGVLLFHCDSEWTTLGCSAHQSVPDAKTRAERIYPGISTRWVDAGVSEEAAEVYLNEQFGNARCSFCGKRPDEVEQMFFKEGEGKDEVGICNQCIKGFHDGLPK